MTKIETVARALAAKHDKEHGTMGAVLAYNAGSIATQYWDGLAKVAIATMPLKAGDAVRMRVGSPADNGEILYIHDVYATVSFGGRAMPHIVELERLERVLGADG